jgi:hypothetical protein
VHGLLRDIYVAGLVDHNRSAHHIACDALVRRSREAAACGRAKATELRSQETKTQSELAPVSKHALFAMVVGKVALFGCSRAVTLLTHGRPLGRVPCRLLLVKVRRLEPR